MTISEYDLYLFGRGEHHHVYRVLGAHPQLRDGVAGVHFAVWAPNARAVSVVGDFNDWQAPGVPLTLAHEVWSGFVPGVAPGNCYKYRVDGADGYPHLKADPYAQASEFRPDTASRVVAPSQFVWSDEAWLSRRAARSWLHEPMSIYELHLGSWRCWPDGGWYGYRDLAQQLVTYAREQGFTHLELMPIAEYPFDGSWGYQTVGMYAPTSRYGSPDDLRWFVDHCHANGIGVLLDWVPAHFPRDAHGLSWFDGGPLYEHPNPLRGEHPDWGTLIYDYGRPQVKNFLISNAIYWLEEFHFDGLRVDAVSSMIRLDYSRDGREWSPNEYGGPENLEAIAFLQDLNRVVHEAFPGAVTVAEEATSWPGVSRPVYLGGLGFSMKWNMGWMHDTLDYFKLDPLFRKYHHELLTFGVSYAWNENFVLPLSHDEVVHGKSPLIYKMPGDDWQKFASLRALLALQWTYPGKKLLFMGGEFAQTREWHHERPLDWALLEHAAHRGVQQLVADLNALYRSSPELHRLDFDPSGFQWIDCHDHEQSVVSFLRFDGRGGYLVVVANFTPVPRSGYRLGVPRGGVHRECFNSDSGLYGGSNFGNQGAVMARDEPWMGKPCCLELSLPPLAVLVLAPPEAAGAPASRPAASGSA